MQRRLALVSPQKKISDYENNLRYYNDTIQKLVSEIYNEKANQITTLSSKLETLNTLSILSRGYSIAEKDGKVISSKTDLKLNDEFTLKLSDGKITAKVTGE